jgi:hypothetical protein
MHMATTFNEANIRLLVGLLLRERPGEWRWASASA